MKIILSGPSVTVENALLRALSGTGHQVALVGAGKSDVAKRWPDSVTAIEHCDAARALGDADLAMVVDGRVALRPAPSPVAAASEEAEVAAALAWLEGARRVVVVAPPGSETAVSCLGLARRTGAPWMSIEADAVFGAASPHEDLVSAMLALVRTLPVVPVRAAASARFAPLCATDLAHVVLAAVATDGAWNRTYCVRGAETASIDDLLGRLAELAQRKLRRLPLPSFLSGAGSALARLFGAPPAYPDDETLSRIVAGGSFSAGHAPASADAFTTFAIAPTPLGDALRQLAEELPEQRPTEGYGALEHKRFWVEITGSALGAEALLEVFRRDCAEIMPIEFDVEQSDAGRVERGRMLTAALPMRGHIQMRVEETLPRRITFATVEGHPIAGVVRFMTEPVGSAVRFAVEVYARSATPLDFVALKAGGSIAQDMTWSTVCERMLERSGGKSSGVEHTVEALDGANAHHAEAWIEEMITRRERSEHEAEAAHAPD